MKKIAFIILLAAFSSTGSFAQSGSGNISFNTNPQVSSATVDAQAKDETDKLNNIVQLTSDEYSKALQINKNFFAQIGSTPSVTSKGHARAAYGREQQLKTLLTSDQWQMLQNAKANGQW